MTELGHCCYGGQKPKEDCASCSLWRSSCSTLCHPEEPCSITQDGVCVQKNRPSCFNRPPYKTTVEVQVGWTEDGRRDMTTILDSMSKGCAIIHPPFGEAYLKKWNCVGCRWNNISD